ncbi:hypothetical protein [Desulfurobacterium atlanticum]|uniref:Putative lipoprotein n=1 Tax=Desulfurobacterium atlanticum TaxID=240169 RepID=A0A238YGL0_9BACT|nr:hypothetical protein [Desulfurobacterium atlanticum]SNR70335.1 Putative lipoprotein [Desulfurobacterium atlanticum]
MRKMVFIFVIFTSFIFGCASNQGSINYFVKPKSASKITRVAVLPFMNLTTDKFAGERARDFVITALLEKGIDVVPKGAVDREVKRLGVPSGFFFDVNDLRVLADVLKVNGFVQGSVDEYKIERRGTYAYPVVAVTLKVLDTNGNVVWQASGVKSYYSTVGRLFGLKSKDPVVALKDFVYELLETFNVKAVKNRKILRNPTLSNATTVEK